MATLIAVMLMMIFLFLSGLHIYWGLGGVWGSSAVVPTKDDHVKVIKPGMIPTFLVALGLLGFGLIILLNIPTLGCKFPLWLDLIHQYGLWVIVSIFLLRAVGDFNYIGIFKKYKHTKFGQNDTKYYSPLCLVISLLTLLLVLMK